MINDAITCVSIFGFQKFDNLNNQTTIFIQSIANFSEIKL